MEVQQAAPKVRKLTVCFKGVRRSCKYLSLPIITITGKWLEEMGFQPGHGVDITCEKRKLTITISKEQRFGRR